MTLLFDNTRNIVDKIRSEVYFPVMKLEDAAKQLEALGNPTRLAIYRVLIRLGDQGCPVGEIKKKLDIPASTLSHHIAKLVHSGLITQERDSRSLYCAADFKNMNALMTFLVRNCCAEDSCVRLAR
jgi:ArsR family transcriptional regulator